jgi:hypothetical protein
VIGGYIPGAHGLDSIVVGYYKGKDLVYVARVRSGFVPGVTAPGVRTIAILGNAGLSFVIFLRNIGRVVAKIDPPMI